MYNNIIDIIINNKQQNATKNAICIKEMYKYMLTDEFKTKYINPIPIPIPIPIVEETVTKPIIAQIIQPIQISTIIAPKQKNTLFWCIYIAGMSHTEYLHINRNYGVYELEIKYKINEYIQNNISKFTNNKITKKTIQEISSELITNINTTNLQCVIAMIMYYNINIILIDHTDKLLLEFISLCDNPTYLMKKDKYGKYNIDTNIIGEVEIQTLKNTRIKLETIQKPLKSISSYKMSDLIDMLTILDIDFNIKSKKQELYSILVQNVKCI
jgi:hypothetical protein